MKKIVKIIGAAGAVAAAAALVPYHFNNDKENGTFELGGLLWKLRKEAGEEEDTYTMELLPFMKKDENAEPAVKVEIGKEGEDAPAEENAEEEPFAEKAQTEVVVESAEESPVEEPFAEEDTEAVIEIEVEDGKAETPAAETPAEE